MERRAFPRLRSKINARLLVNNTDDSEGVVSDFSASGAAVESALEVSPGDRIVLHLEGGNRFEGVVARCFEGGFGVEFGMHESKRQRLINALESVTDDASEMTSLPLQQRVANRVGGFRGKAVCRTEEGEVECRLIDMSLSGAAIETDADLKLGSVVSLGQTKGRIVRKEGKVFGIQFDPTGQAGAKTTDAPADKPAARPVKKGLLRQRS